MDGGPPLVKGVHSGDTCTPNLWGGFFGRGGGVGEALALTHGCVNLGWTAELVMGSPLGVGGFTMGLAPLPHDRTELRTSELPFREGPCDGVLSHVPLQQV